MKVLQNKIATAKINLSNFGRKVKFWSKRLTLVSVLLTVLAATASWYTMSVLVPHAHNIYSLAKLVYGEARGESRLGQKAIFGTIDVRVEHRYFPDTIHGVVFQPYSTTDAVLQYNAMGDNVQEDLSTEVGQTILRRVAWWYLQQQLGIFRMPSEAAGAHSYCVPSACERQVAYFGRLQRIGQIGNHVFYGDATQEEVAQARGNLAPMTSLRPVLRPDRGGSVALTTSPRPQPRPVPVQSVVLSEQIDQLIARVLE